MRSVLVAMMGWLFATAVFGQESVTTERSLKVEAVVCAGVEGREPVNTADSFTVGVGTIYFWTKITGAMDSISINHVWTYEGQEIAVVSLPVRSSSWRTWSSKNILPNWVGNWEIKVTDNMGEVLLAKQFKIHATSVQAPPKPEPDSTERGIDSL